MSLPKAELARLRALRDKKHREAAGRFVIEGEKVVGELLAAGYPLREIYATRPWLEENPAAAQRLAATEVSPAEMARASHYPTPSSVLAVGEITRPPLAAVTLDRGYTLALDGIQDPGNVGTLLRLADWFALDRVLLSPESADLFSQKVINASMGSFARVTVHRVPLVAALAAAKVPVLGCDLSGDDVHRIAPLRAAVIVVGSEGRGLSPEMQARVTQRVTIPRPAAAPGTTGGRPESLNAALAAAIVCDNLRRISG